MKVILTGKFDLEITEEMHGWSREDVRQWALAHLQNVDLEVFDWDVEFDDAMIKNDEIKRAIFAIRRHNQIHRNRDPRAIHITRYLEAACAALEALRWRDAEKEPPEEAHAVLSDKHEMVLKWKGEWFRAFVKGSETTVRAWIPLPEYYVADTDTQTGGTKRKQGRADREGS